MYTYDVTASKQGSTFATIRVSADNALVAINQAEMELHLKRQSLSLSDKAGNVRQVVWTGYDMQARRVN
jgi:hypothetical protein